MNAPATWIILRTELLALRHRVLKRSPIRLGLLALFLVAASVFIGGGAFTVSVASLLVALPKVLETMQRNFAPLSASVVEAIV